MKTRQDLHDGRIFIMEYHLCLKCFRLINCSMEQYACIEKGGKLFYAHYRCAPLKQVSAK